MGENKNNSLIKITKSIYDKLKEEAEIVGWETKTSSEKNMIIAIYDTLFENNFPNDKIRELALKIVNLAKHHL